MPTTTMTIQYVNPPKNGKQRGSIKSTDGDMLGCFADKLHLFEVGGTYEIEYTQTESGGTTYQNVKSATRVETPANATSHAPVGGDIFRQTHPIDSERMFLCSVLNAFIQSGAVKLDKSELAAATTIIRGLYRFNYGDGFAVQQQRRANG